MTHKPLEFVAFTSSTSTSTSTLTHTMQRLPQLPSVADLIRTYGLSAKSQLAQNFILDLNITRLLQQASSSCMLVEA
jgi:hypothetical protein